MTANPCTRSRVIEEVRLWLGTPYRHQASACGAGCDCLGLVRGIWRALYHREPAPIPPYKPDWSDRSGEDRLLNAAQTYLISTPLDAAQPGDVVLFGYRSGAPACHCGVLSARGMMIHAWQGHGVVQTGLTPWWRRRLRAAFVFPEC